MSFSITTWNVNSLNVRLPHVLTWLAQNQVDILCLQETKLTDDNFPREAIEQVGYQCCYFGQKTYNGIAILSKTASTQVAYNNPYFDDIQARIISATFQHEQLGELRVINAYFPNGEAVGSEKYTYKLKWLSALQSLLAEQCKRYENVLLLGDFNIAPQDEDTCDPELWRGKILCSDSERQHFSDFLKLGFYDAFRSFDQAPASFTWWDYRQASFRRNLGLRIDHILVTTPLRNRLSTCAIDMTPRKQERPSDHTPVIATFT